MKPEKARIGDIAQIQKLVNHFAAQGEMLPRALSELYENVRDFLVVREGDEVVGCAALHVFWSDLAEIRAVAVAEEMQEKGVGLVVVGACLDEARELGIETVFCLTYRPEFFGRFGFQEVDKKDLPHKIWGECLRCPKFPDCDEVAMVCPLGK
ncbi:MAG: N-acetyltransferase [Chloroflexota bacterium]|nr:N-acetyltransferase [Chloroflexota bacterium]